MSRRPGLSALGALVRRVDPDRFLCALFAPPERRETLFALYAFNHELARAWEVASQPTLALIRLQWWREVVEGAARTHEVATPLAAELRQGRLDPKGLLALIDGRERIEAGVSTVADWQGLAQATAGMVAVATARVLGGEPSDMARVQALGTGYGVAGLLRSTGRWGGEAAAGPAAALRPALAAWARGLLGAPAPLPRRVIAAGLPGVLARRDLARTPVRRGAGDRLAVTIAAVRGRA